MTSTRAVAVIGANFGDEGKGLAVDCLAARLTRPLVVRFNGGAQAGHTVTLADGRRHVFSHVGAGAFADAPTFLSRFFVVNPMVFAREMAELDALGVRPKILVDPDAQVTTPFDVLINRWIEEVRGVDRHGSVGIGFGETIERAERGFGLKVRDLSDDREVADHLMRLRHAWLPVRLARLGIPYTAERAQAAAGQQITARYLAEVRLFARLAIPAAIDMAVHGRDVIFEGAQGLLLDQERGLSFPHVTRSHTGLKNVLALARDVGIGHLDAVYMSRAYLTRHGAGPLENESARLAFADVVDATNRPNPWQGSLRLAPLDLDLLRHTIHTDKADALGSGVTIDARVGFTCLDQIRDAAKVHVGGRAVRTPARRLTAVVGDFVGLSCALEAWGPSRAAVRLVGAAPRRASARGRHKSWVRCAVACSHTLSRSSSKTSPGSAGAVYQTLRASSPSSWPGAQPA
jgi:adenylosuccinate synthase